MLIRQSRARQWYFNIRLAARLGRMKSKRRWERWEVRIRNKWSRHREELSLQWEWTFSEDIENWVIRSTEVSRTGISWPASASPNRSEVFPGRESNERPGQSVLAVSQQCVFIRVAVENTPGYSRILQDTSDTCIIRVIRYYFYVLDCTSIILHLFI